jgi:hypothetical protein
MFLAGNYGHHEVVLQVMSTEVEDEVVVLPCLLILAVLEVGHNCWPKHVVVHVMSK